MEKRKYSELRGRINENRKKFGHYDWLSHKDDEKMNSEHVIMIEIGNTTYIYIYMK